MVEERLMGKERNWKEYEVGRKMLERKDEKGRERRKIQGQFKDRREGEGNSWTEMRKRKKDGE